MANEDDCHTNLTALFYYILTHVDCPSLWLFIHLLNYFELILHCDQAIVKRLMQEIMWKEKQEEVLIDVREQMVIFRQQKGNSLSGTLGVGSPLVMPKQ